VTTETVVAGAGTVLDAKGLRAKLGGVEILRGVDLSVERGRVLGVLGPSGAGKSTLFRVLVGELRPTSGEVWLDGQRITTLALWRRARVGMGYVPQTPSVLFDLTVADNIRVFERVARRERLPTKERAALVGLEDRLAVHAADLSGGERRRLDLLRALIAEPRVLICDEPLTGVDPVGAVQLGELLRACADRGVAVVLADHRVREALSICDSAVLLVDGQVAFEAPPQDFADHPAVKQRYLG
jgi:lipopolysaccharide export system ATP-binding protein